MFVSEIVNKRLLRCFFHLCPLLYNTNTAVTLYILKGYLFNLILVNKRSFTKCLNFLRRD